MAPGSKLVGYGAEGSSPQPRTLSVWMTFQKMVTQVTLTPKGHERGAHHGMSQTDHILGDLGLGLTIISVAFAVLGSHFGHS